METDKVLLDALQAWRDARRRTAHERCKVRANAGTPGLAVCLAECMSKEQAEFDKLVRIVDLVDQLERI